MTPIKRRLLYIFRDTLLRLRITWDHGKTLTLSVGYHVDRARWDGQRCTRNSTHGPDRIPAATINRVLDNLEGSVDRAFWEYESTDRIPSPVQLRQSLDSTGSDRRDIRADFFDFLRDGERQHQWSANTLKTVRSFLSLLTAFAPDLAYSDIDPDGEWLGRFIAWQQSNKLLKGAKKKTGDTIRLSSGGYSNSVIEKNCRTLKWFLRWAARKHLVDPALPESIRADLKTVDRPVIYLEWDELMRLYNADLEPGSLPDRVRDIFCFCSFSSLRYSDAIALRKSQIGRDTITVVAQKTSDTLIIDLNTFTRAILRKYRDLSGDRALPGIQLRDFNYHLKALARSLALDRPIHIVQYFGAERKEKTEPLHRLISSHCARRTFIVAALSMGISPVVVMRWTGHADYSAMRPYIAIADASRRQSMTLFDARAGSPPGFPED